MRFVQLAFLTLLLATGFGCSSSVQIGDDDAGTARDSGPEPERDGGTGETCGPTASCGAGTYCCNASCGICAPEGTACTQEVCEPIVCGGTECEDPNATCCPACSPGEEICAGPDGACPPIACPASCANDSECGTGMQCCAGCTPEDDGFCIAESDPCPDLDCREMCGDALCGFDEQCCDSGCPGVDDFCAPAGETCVIPDCPAPTCDPFQAWGVGDCDAAFGVKWNGSYCEAVNGCDCLGGDCGRLYSDMEECRSYHEGSCGSVPGCENDLDCPEQMYCNGCAHGSCPGCLDCVADCVPSPCATEGEPACDEERPECGTDGLAVVKDGCWVCVEASTCEPITDCRATGCESGQTCQPCFTEYACIPDGAVC